MYRQLTEEEIVDGIDEAIDFINTHGTKHSHGALYRYCLPRLTISPQEALGG